MGSFLKEEIDEQKQDDECNEGACDRRGRPAENIPKDGHPTVSLMNKHGS
jgi:hypothetical protein